MKLNKNKIYLNYFKNYVIKKLIDYEKNFLNTIKLLITNPHKVFSDYIEDILTLKKPSHVSPIKLLIISFFLNFLFLGENVISQVENSEQESKEKILSTFNYSSNNEELKSEHIDLHEKLTEKLIIINNDNYEMLFHGPPYILLISLITWILSFKYFNFIENIIFNSYLYSIFTFWGLMYGLLYYIFGYHDYINQPLTFIQMIYGIYFYLSILKPIKVKIKFLWIPLIFLFLNPWYFGFWMNLYIDDFFKSIIYYFILK